MHMHMHSVSVLRPQMRRVTLSHAHTHTHVMHMFTTDVIRRVPGALLPIATYVHIHSHTLTLASRIYTLVTQYACAVPHTCTEPELQCHQQSSKSH